MTIKVFDSDRDEITIDDNFASLMFKRFNSDLDPRVSSCVHCNSAVVAYDPFERLIEQMSTDSNVDNEIAPLNVFIENVASIHLYIWEENNCIHSLWLDPLFAEWSKATGEKRIRH